MAGESGIGAKNPALVLGDFEGDEDVDQLLCEYAGSARLVVNRQRDLD